MTLVSSLITALQEGLGFSQSLEDVSYSMGLVDLPAWIVDPVDRGDSSTVEMLDVRCSALVGGRQLQVVPVATCAFLLGTLGKLFWGSVQLPRPLATIGAVRPRFVFFF